MNKIFLATGMVALMAAAVSCDTYDIYPDEYAKVIMIKDAGERSVTVYPTDPVSPVNITVMKGGHKPGESSTITLQVMDEAAWEAYDEETGRGFYWSPLPDSCYYFTTDVVAGQEVYKDSESYTFTGEDDRYHQFSLNLIPGAIYNWMQENDVTETTLESGDVVLIDKDGKYPVIGVNLVTDEESTSINENGNQLLVRPVVRKATLDFYTAVDGDTTNVISRVYSVSEAKRADVYRPTLGLSIPCQNNWGFSVTLQERTDLLTAYVREQGLDIDDFVKMPTEMYSFEGENVSLGEPSSTGLWRLNAYLPKGTQSVDLGLSIDVTKIDVESDLNKVYYLGFGMLTSLTWDDENNTTDQLQLSSNGAVSGKPRTFFVTVSAQALLPLIELDGSEVTANDCEPTEGSIEYLFDEDTSTFYHSTWSTTVTHDATYGSYLEFDLTGVAPAGISQCFFVVTPRGNTNVTGFPTSVAVYGSNDATEWTQFAINGAAGALTVAVPESGETNIGTQSNHFSTEGAYKYIRFCVLKSNNGVLTTSNSCYWNLSELKMYGE